MSVITPTIFAENFDIISWELNFIIVITAIALFLIYFNLILQKQFTKCFYEDEPKTKQTKDSFRVQ